MIKKFSLLVIASIFSINLSAAELKIGFVSMGKLSSDAPQAIDINKQLQAAVSEPKEELTRLSDEIKAMGKKIKKDELMMAPSRLENLNKEYREKIVAFKEKELAFNQGVQNAQTRASSVFGKIVLTAVNKLAQDEKYDLILHEGVIYANPEHDVTDKVLSILKKEYDKQKAEENKKQ
ncbi:MAG: OmpH family outer membrane protein [Gammaproteobacteria bacterium]|nr:OmpH family outer membrane protein [Gammaproteobacteria bacterium]